MHDVFTVFGATGQQGAALIKFLLTDSLSQTYHIRGITRDAKKPAALALREQGVEVVEADIDDSVLLEAAVAGSYAVFAVTNYWEKASAAVETRQGKAIADAAVKAGTKLLIWSSLPRTGVGHFDSKADVEDYIRTLPIKSLFYMPGFFMQNFLVIMKPRPRDDGVYVMAKPWPSASANTPIPLVDIHDTGMYLHPFLENLDKYNQAVITASTDFCTPTEICETWTKVTGSRVVFDETHDGVSDSDMTPRQKEALTNNNVAVDSSYYGAGGRDKWRWTLAQLKKKPTTWERFVWENEPWFPKK